MENKTTKPNQMSALASEFKDPVIRRWLVYPYDLDNASRTKIAARALLTSLDDAWLKNGILPIEDGPGSLLDKVDQLPVPQVLEMQRWRHWGIWHENATGKVGRRVSAFLIQDALVIALEIGEHTPSMKESDVPEHWAALSALLPCPGPGVAAAPGLGSWDHRIIELTGSLRESDMLGCALGFVQADVRNFLVAESLSQRSTLVWVHQDNDPSREALDDFLASEEFRLALLAAVKLVPARRGYQLFRSEMDKSRDQSQHRREHGEMSLEKLETQALETASLLLFWQGQLAEHHRQRIVVEVNLWNLRRKSTRYPGLGLLFLRTDLLGETLLQQMTHDASHYETTLNELKTAFEVSDLQIQLKEAGYSRSVNHAFAIFSVLGVMLSLGQIFPQWLQNLAVRLGFFSTTATLMVLALATLLRRGSIGSGHVKKSAKPSGKSNPRG